MSDVIVAIVIPANINNTTTTITKPNFKSFTIIHELYQEALKESDDILEIVRNFLSLLQQPDILKRIPEDELDSFLIFRSDVSSCFNERATTFQLTNLINDVLTLILYIILYYNNTSPKPHVDMNINSRRKSLKRDFAKMLRKAFNRKKLENMEVANWGVKDRFGLRGILLNKNLSSEENVELLLKITKFIFGILTNTTANSDDFIEWIQNSNMIDGFTKIRLIQTLSLPFQLDRYKDFVSNPKENKYQSIHFTLVLPHYSPICPGAFLDFQFRNSEMHKVAESGPASHIDYEEETSEYTEVFDVDDFSKLNIVGFDEVTDTDGINHAKAILNRRVSATLVP